MEIREKVYDIVVDLLSDGEGHEITELIEELQSRLGINYNQAKGRIYQMAKRGMIESNERGVYSIPTVIKDKTVNYKLYFTLISIKKLIDEIGFTCSEAVRISGKDIEVLEVLKEIEAKAEAGIQICSEDMDES